MDFFERMERWEHEEVIFWSDKSSGLRAIIAVHNTVLGPAVGGCRMWPYESFDEALDDVLRLSRGMTYKAAAAGLNLGGGKAVIIGDSTVDKSEVLFRSFGRFVDGLQGRYITAEDVGTSVEDMEYVLRETPFVTGFDRSLGGSGDPSPVTALGVLHGIKACVKRRLGKNSLEDVRVTVQGLGHVGSSMVEHLLQEGAQVTVTDVNPHLVEGLCQAHPGIEWVKPDAIYDVKTDVFCPCALGGVLNDDTIPRLKVSIVAGAANNQLSQEERHGWQLKERGIFYAPDYVINAGGLISVTNELEGYPQERALAQVHGIYETLLTLFELSEHENIPTYQAANRFAEERLRRVGALKLRYGQSRDILRRRRTGV
jgi:leucine dehydrogenase